MRKLLYGLGAAATVVLLFTVAMLFRSLMTLGRSANSRAFEPPRVELQAPSKPQLSTEGIVSPQSRGESASATEKETEVPQPAASTPAVISEPQTAAPDRPMPSEKAVGKIVFVRGKATASYPKTAERALSMESPVFSNDRIACESGAKVQIEFEDGSVIWLGETSQMIIDEYVYDPARQTGGGCIFKFLKGTCRVITGALTAVNPDRFRMRTGMTTIGIRGCEVGILCEEARNSVYAIALGNGETLVIETTGDGSPVMDSATGEALAVEDAKKHTLTLSQAGTAVTVVPGRGAQARAFDEKEISQFTKSTSHLPPARYDLLQEPDGALLILRPQTNSRSQEVVL